jgi:hypothetical protein
MNGRMKHHRSCDRHYRSDFLLRNADVVERTNTGKPHDLSKRRKVLGELSGGKNLGVIRQVFLRHDSVLTTGESKLLLCSVC